MITARAAAEGPTSDDGKFGNRDESKYNSDSALNKPIALRELLPSGRKRGRPPRDHISAIVDAIFPGWSARTRARYTRAWRLAQFAGVDIVNLIPRVTRTNGTVDVAKLLELAEGVAAIRAVERHQVP
jgi:hypothetical protein